MEVKGLKKGYTTGTCAAAAAKAAAMLLMTGRIARSVELVLPRGEPISIPIFDHELRGDSARCCAIKDAGDDIDVTHGARVFAEVEYSGRPALELSGGEGVGVVTKPGLQVAVGEAAINPVPRKMIEEALAPLGQAGLIVTISIPGGAELAKKTFNARLGIAGGLSILGTTGIVEPRSVDAYKATIVCALDIAKAQSPCSVALVPGNIGEKGLVAFTGARPDAVVQVGNFIGFGLEAAVERGFRSILLGGHPGKLAKLARGDFDTHWERSKSAMPVIIEAVETLSEDEELRRRVREESTADGAAGLILAKGEARIFGYIALMVKRAAEALVGHRAEVEVLMTAMDGRALGFSPGAKNWRHLQ